jgi:hypothetical protein
VEALDILRRTTTDLIQGMEQDPHEIRFRRIEKKLNLLISLAAIQLLLLLIVVVSLFLPSTFTLVLILLSLAVLAFVFRNQIPNWFGSLSRYIFGLLFSAQKSDSMKDLK